MSTESLAKVIERAASDASFRAQLQSNPDAALAEYQLSADERAALLSGDSSKLSSLGVDARVSKIDGSTLNDGSSFGINGPFS